MILLKYHSIGARARIWLGIAFENLHTALTENGKRTNGKQSRVHKVMWSQGNCPQAAQHISKQQRRQRE